MKIRNFAFVALAASFFLVASGRAHALDCGRRLILAGDPMARVRALCGEPTSSTTRTESHSTFGIARGPGVSVGESHTVTIQIEVWVYDFGPRRFMEELTFANGILRSSRALGYGNTRAMIDAGPQIRSDRRGALLACASVTQGTIAANAQKSFRGSDSKRGQTRGVNRQEGS